MAAEPAIRFESALRRRVLVGVYDIDIIWSNLHKRTTGHGQLRGLAMIQKMKPWRGQYWPKHYSLSFCANNLDGNHREFNLRQFEKVMQIADKEPLVARVSVIGRRTGRQRQRLSGSAEGGNGDANVDSESIWRDLTVIAIQFTYGR